MVQGAGQTGLWEDMAGRKGNIQTVRAFRKNIAVFAANSAEARKAWVEKTDLDAWLIWNIWQVANKDLADLVPIKEAPKSVHGRPHINTVWRWVYRGVRGVKALCHAANYRSSYPQPLATCAFHYERSHQAFSVSKSISNDYSG